MSVTVQLVGGLGNQLFQYALGLSLSLKLGQALDLDIAPFKNYKLHHYALDHFNISAKKTNLNKLNIFLSRLFKLRFITELSFEYQPEILKLKTRKNIYLKGYWQSEKYFSDIRPVLIKELTLKSSLNTQDLGIITKIKEAAVSVSLHVRRSDYFNNKETLSIHGICSLDYYEKAIALLEKKYDSLILFIFSDDIAWAKENIKTKFPTVFVDHNTAERNYADLYLISQCQHHIIANSSFSWWGAWLSDFPQKTVIAPRDWFQDRTRNTADLIPANWIRI